MGGGSFKLDPSRLERPLSQMTESEMISLLNIQLRSDPVAQARYRDYLAGWVDSLKTFEKSSYRGFAKGERRETQR